MRPRRQAQGLLFDSHEPDTALVVSDEDRMPDYQRALALLAAIAGDKHSVYFIQILGAPSPKARPRFGQGRAYSSVKSRNAESETSTVLRRMMSEPLTGNVALACIFFRANRQRIDADNMLKHVCDAANGILWVDDSQVTAIVGIVELDPANPRTLVAIAPHLTTLTRGTDDLQTCAMCGKQFYRAGRNRRINMTCSRDCAGRARGFEYLNEPVPCAQCGKPFKRTTSAQKMCSVECRSDSVRNRNKGRASDRPLSRCIDCGTQLTHRKGGRCRECWRLHVAQARMGRDQ